MLEVGLLLVAAEELGGEFVPRRADGADGMLVAFEDLKRRRELRQLAPHATHERAGEVGGGRQWPRVEDVFEVVSYYPLREKVLKLFGRVVAQAVGQFRVEEDEGQVERGGAVEG